MECEGDVLHHDHHVCHCNPCEKKVDGVGPHVLVSQDQNVHDVEDGPQGADSDSQVPMDWLVQGLVIRVVSRAPS